MATSQVAQAETVTVPVAAVVEAAAQLFAASVLFRAVAGNDSDLSMLFGNAECHLLEAAFGASEDDTESFWRHPQNVKAELRGSELAAELLDSLSREAESLRQDAAAMRETGVHPVLR
jgi:hypothetical protein